MHRRLPRKRLVNLSKLTSRCCPPRPGGPAGAAVSRPPGARCAPLRKGAPLRRRAARLPLLPALSRRVLLGRLSAARRAHNMRPHERGPRCAAGLRGCCRPPRSGGLVGAAMSRPRAHDVRPYERVPRCAAVLRGCRCCPPRWPCRGGYQPPAGARCASLPRGGPPRCHFRGTCPRKRQDFIPSSADDLSSLQEGFWDKRKRRVNFHPLTRRCFDIL